MARDSVPPPSPERDRAMAAKVRHAPRGAIPLGEVLDRVLDRQTMARMRRFGRVAGVLRDQLSERERARVRPVALAGGTLTLEVDDGMLLAELAQHRAHAIETALVAAGTGAGKVRFRLAKAKRR
jgi:hypothetical protein